MKKALCILAALMMVVTFSATGFAADASCTGCKDKNGVAAPVPKIFCPEDQGSILCPFDYDDGNWRPADDSTTVTAPNYAINGYCDWEATQKVILDICSCPDSCQIQVGMVLGVKIEILTPGIYFAYDPNVTTGTSTGGVPADNRLSFSLYPKTGINAACAAAGHNKYFTDAAYYRNNNLNTAVAPAQMCNSVADANKAKVLMVGKSGGYVITEEDVINKRCQMWLDVPAMILNASEYNASTMAGKPIQIRVSAFSEIPNANRADTDIANTNPLNVPALNVDSNWASFSKYLCPDCYAPCGCTFTIGEFCCPTGDASGAYSMLYPYFADDAGESDYWNGIAITNLTDTAGTATLTIYETDGDVGTASINVGANGVVAYLLSGIPGATLSKKGTGAGAGTLFDQRCYIQVDTNFRADGFAMISDNANNGASMGYLPRIK